MELADWLPAISTSVLLSLALWLGRNLFLTRLKSTVEHEFNAKLEAIRADFRHDEELLKANLRSKELEIIALRDGALTALASKQMTIDRRRIEAVDQLWSTVISMGGYKALVSAMSSVKCEDAASGAVTNQNIREMFATILKIAPSSPIDTANSGNARPYLSPMVWSLFRAYCCIPSLAFAQCVAIKEGVGAKIIDSKSALQLIRAVLPHHSSGIDEYGYSYFFFLMEEIEEMLLAELQKMIYASDENKSNINNAAEILQMANKVMASVTHSQAIRSPDEVKRNPGYGL